MRAQVAPFLDHSRALANVTLDGIDDTTIDIEFAADVTSVNSAFRVNGIPADELEVIDSTHVAAHFASSQSVGSTWDCDTDFVTYDDGIDQTSPTSGTVNP